MSQSENFFQQLTDLNSQVKSGFERLNGLQSALDREVSDIYHAIERLDSVDGPESRELMRRLKRTLAFRRVIKDQIKKIQPVFHMLRENMGNVESQYDKIIRKSVEIRSELNSTMTIDEVMEALSHEGCI